jgi:hypothetical protein
VYARAQFVDVFYDMSENDEFVFMFSHPDIVRILAKFCCDLLKLRNETVGNPCELVTYVLNSHDIM